MEDGLRAKARGFVKRHPRMIVLVVAVAVGVLVVLGFTEAVEYLRNGITVVEIGNFTAQAVNEVKEP